MPLRLRMTGNGQNCDGNNSSNGNSSNGNSSNGNGNGNTTAWTAEDAEVRRGRGGLQQQKATDWELL
jgi:hypothetical protein